jgi:hypothetical protein
MWLEQVFSSNTVPQPFEHELAVAAPIVTRLQTMWKSSRAQLLEDFPAAPGRPMDRKAYLQQIDESYCADAHHSLSIEGYDVSPELFDRVRAGNC